MKIVREIIVKEVVFIKNRHSNFDTITGDHKFAKCLYESEHSKEILSFSFSNAQKILSQT
jgi:hypothetical protein